MEDDYRTPMRERTNRTDVDAALHTPFTPQASLSPGWAACMQTETPQGAENMVVVEGSNAEAASG